MHRISMWVGALAFIPAIACAQMRAADGLVALEAGDLAGAVAIWTPLAERGDLLAQFNMGVLALQGQGGLTPAQADGFLTPAAQNGDVPAQMLLADLAVDRQDWTAAQSWYQAAATAGDARAQFMAGRLADDGLAGAVDPDAAARWYELAARQDFVPAQLALGRLKLDKGNPEEGGIWLERAALAGQVDAQFDLAVLLASGMGVAQDLPAARNWYFRAAQAGNTNAMRNLSLMQARGQGGARSFRAALAWALLAGPDGSDLVPALRDVMSQDDQSDALGLSQTCRTAPAPEVCE